MKIALVAMPWARFDSPSAALGLLTAVVRREAGKHQVESIHAYLDAFDLLDDAYEPISASHPVGELIYAAQLFPEKRESVKKYFLQWSKGALKGVDGEDARSELFDRILQGTGDHAQGLAGRLAESCHLVGFTTSFCQLFPSLLVARQIKQLNPEITIALGGAGVSHEVGPSVLREFSEVDFVVQGEGEKRLLFLLELIQGGRTGGPRQDGVLSREIVPTPTDEADRVALDDLPLPDYDEYYDKAESRSILWRLPIEGSRGCWWDRAPRTCNPMDSCYFCSLNKTTYRQKSAGQVGAEMRALSERYRNVRFSFLDNIIRHREVEELTDAIRACGKSFRYFYEIRASIQPYDLLQLWRSGCEEVQIGIEGLSSRYLKRIGKGTSTIQNLQAMKTCYELGIGSGSNLLTRFPGSTAEEVEETRDNILRYAIAYQPTNLSTFTLNTNSAVHRRPEEFGVTNIRNSQTFQHALPADLWQSLSLFWLDFDCDVEQVSWHGVEEACEQWRALHRKLTLEAGTEWFLGVKPLVYLDGGTFLEIIDRRHDYRIITLERRWREIYLHSAQIRSSHELRHTFAPDQDEETVDEILAALVGEDLMFTEGERYLSLAVAPTPQIAAERIERTGPRRSTRSRRPSR